MKNADVPLWDKGDSTDNYSKGGAAPRRSSFEGMLEMDKNTEKIFKLVLGRKPSTRESAYYRISRMEKGDIILKLLSGQEHKDLVSKAKKYPDLIKENREQKSTILKLKSEHESRVQEFEDLSRLLSEKNNMIVELRKNKDKPYISDKRILEESTSHYSKHDQREYAKNSSKEESWFDKIIDLFFR